MADKQMILVTGACGQIGTELVSALRVKYGTQQVIATDIRDATVDVSLHGPYYRLDVMDKDALYKLVSQHQVTHIYHLAAVLSATGEKSPLTAWDLNMRSLLNVLEVARTEKLKQVFWPSSIAVFGAKAPKESCPQYALTVPSTVYGISKVAGEQWCQYYHEQYGLDVRSIRYPGLISYSAKAGGGTTDYAVDIFQQAVNNSYYHCYLLENTRLPMLYMPDAVRATLELMDAPAEKISVRTSYNLAGISFTPQELAAVITDYIPDFRIDYQPDKRQQIAESWPSSIDDRQAREEWGWKPAFDIKAMTADMLLHTEREVISTDCLES
ncbi:NAD-dependent epimerase/dehydratase family protein [Mucilaginibacter sp. SP1R1]|uniref:NAD-dependent epimerase/dehydratase family protein n=1 Tax=Mucilaginibacter sp. SP1R1 TaxID=2723091 RepID=UPI00161C4D04|nr:NAD-dependent epimerase/dehydratase family protein [Mucilaginibacter sp. SP1R1]MBB6152626.1 nucleoside-diphosphate-sugar epimerase [Mucilaginibacter sp. SP1R1]